ncbi:MAG: hypothetical protein K2H18_07160, partial [Muribaculaceae bacterium]|nr:hypothetical protein [Muribaculaceae bacterium]
ISLGIPISFVVQRNKEGEIKKLVKNDGYPKISFTFTWQDGRIASMKYEYDGDAEGTDESFTRYIYKDGKVAAMDCQLQYCEGDCETTDAVATVEKEILDVHGNWIKRTLHVKGTKKSDYDYVEHLSNNTHSINVTIIQTRDITYWD